jgi:DNA-binding NtrC family response regulator
VSRREGALAATRGHDVHVGLARFPAGADGTEIAEWSECIRALPGLRWVATMSREQTDHPALKQLIVERLYDFQVEPIDPLRLVHALGHAHGIAEIEQDLLRRTSSSVSGRYGMLGASPAIRTLFDAIERVAAADANLLITGPTGAGKELVATAVHGLSLRAAGPLVSLNCAAIPATLIQSELFGYSRGAFTGASESRPGLIETAAGGTLFLDEIGEMPLESQASLLRFLDSGSIQSLGSETAKKVDVRILAATNRDLEAEVAAGRFRSDLFFRISVLRLRTPPLNERGRDVELLAEHFLRQARLGVDTPVLGLSPEAVKALRRHHWPGNVRELRSRIYQAVLNCERRFIEPADLGLASPVVPESPSPVLTDGRSLSEIRNGVERDAVVSALQRHQRNVARAARDLSVSRMTLYRLMQKHGLAPDDGPLRG